MPVLFGLVLAAPGACTSDEVAVEPTSKASVGPGGRPVTTDQGSTSSSRAVEPDGDPITPDWTIWEWKTVDGRPVSGEIIITHAGPGHCDWESASFLHIGSPLGTIQESGRDVNQYVRDPEGVLSQLKVRFRTTYDPKADLPGDAEFSGYVNNGVELWISQSLLDTAIYMVDGSNVERWPKTEPIVLCD